jgi:hypothetical protein
MDKTGASWWISKTIISRREDDPGGRRRGEHHASRLLSRFREKGCRSFTRHLATPGPPPSSCRDARLRDHPSVAPRVDEAVIVKHFPNSFETAQRIN